MSREEILSLHIGKRRAVTAVCFGLMEALVGGIQQFLSGLAVIRKSAIPMDTVTGLSSTPRCTSLRFFAAIRDASAQLQASWRETYNGKLFSSESADHIFSAELGLISMPAAEAASAHTDVTIKICFAEQVAPQLRPNPWQLWTDLPE